jgi:hypothetical protein
MLVLARVFSSTRLTITAQAVEGPGCPFFNGFPGSAPGGSLSNGERISHAPA